MSQTFRFTSSRLQPRTVDAENQEAGKRKVLEPTGGQVGGTNEPQQRKRAALGALTNVDARRTGPQKPLSQLPSVKVVQQNIPHAVDKENDVSGYYKSKEVAQEKKKVQEEPRCFAVAQSEVEQQFSVPEAQERIAVEDDDQEDMESGGCDDYPRLLDVSCDEDLSEEMTDDIADLEEEDDDDSVKIDAAFEARQDRLITMAEYRDEIYDYLRSAELRFGAKPNYMRKQPDISSNMRSIMIDWMVEVGEEYKLHRETLFLAVNYVDRFLSQMSVQRGKLQLVGTAAMFIAAKYEEIYPPEVKEFAYITDDTYTLQQIIRMEFLMLKALNFEVASITANCFCERYLKESGADEKTGALAMYLIELSLLDDKYLECLPSVTAAAAICLANCTLRDDEPWGESLQETSQYQTSDFEVCLQALHQTYCNASSQDYKAIGLKYSHNRFFQVSKIQPPSFLVM